MDNEVLSTSADQNESTRVADQSLNASATQNPRTGTTTFDLFSVEPPVSESGENPNESVPGEFEGTEKPFSHVQQVNSNGVAQNGDHLHESQYEKLELDNTQTSEKVSASLYASSIASQFEEIEAVTPREGEAQTKSFADLDMDKSTEFEKLPGSDAHLESNDVKTSHANGKQHSGAVSEKNAEQLAASAEGQPLPTQAEETTGSLSDKKADGETEGSSWLDILGDGSLRKRTLRRGAGRHTRPLNGQLCTLVYSAWAFNEDEVKSDQSAASDLPPDATGSLTLPLGESEFCNVFELCASLMEANEVCELTAARRHWSTDPAHNLPVSLANRSPPLATLRFNVELSNVASKPDYATLPIREVCIVADRKRELGNASYSADQQSAAITHYRNAIGVIEESEQGGMATPLSVTDAERAERNELKLKCWANLAAAQLKLKAFDECVRSCDEVLRSQPDNVKVLQRKAKALQEKGELEEALASYKRALALEPTSRFVQNEVNRLEQRIRDANARERTLYKRMFAPPEAPDNDNEQSNANKTKSTAEPKRPATSRWPNLLTSSMVASTACVVIAVVAYAVFKQYASNK